MDLVEFLIARYDEDESWAHEASLLDEINGEGGYVPGGVHWQWTDSHSNPISLDALTMTYADEEIGGGDLLLESVETYDSKSVGKMPQLAIQGAYEVHIPIAVHIARHDPARVLADIAAKRSVVEDYQIVMANNAIEKANDGDEVKIAARELIAKSLRMVLIRLAAPYASHPDFDPAWRTDE